MTLPDRARTFAVERHGSQEYGPGVPYVTHLDAVAAELSSYGPEVQAAGYLHDVLEDTETIPSELDDRFGYRVEMMVILCSDLPGKNRRERKTATHRQLAAVTEPWLEALVVKAVDRLCNLRATAKSRPDLLEMYRAEHADFRAAVERPGWAESFWTEMSAILDSP